MDFIISIVIALAIIAVFILIMLKIAILVLIKILIREGVDVAKKGAWEILQKILTDENAQAAIKKWIGTMFGRVSAAVSGHKK